MYIVALIIVLVIGYLVFRAYDNKKGTTEGYNEITDWYKGFDNWGLPYKPYDSGFYYATPYLYPEYSYWW